MLAIMREPLSRISRTTERKISKSYTKYYAYGNASMSGGRGRCTVTTHDEGKSKCDISPVKKRGS